MRIFIGWDHKENVAYHVLCNSIMRNAKSPVQITPLIKSQLLDIYRRPLDPKQSNDFSFTRFLVPYLSNYEGWSLFMDCDMLVRCDINEIMEWANHYNAVQVVKHDYEPKDKIKFLGAVQYKYPKKNWSSVMLFNNSHYKTRRLTPEYVNTAPALDLHQFMWAEDRTGELPIEYNWLVGEYDENPNAKILHYTVGGPYFAEYKDCDHAAEWYAERSDTVHCDRYVPMEVSRR